jgi:hypothetical protein
MKNCNPADLGKRSATKPEDFEWLGVPRWIGLDKIRGARVALQEDL